MTNEQTLIKDIERLNETKTMDFNSWMIWGITQIALYSARILDNVENMKHISDHGNDIQGGDTE